jgi:hypothetical protein
MLKEGQLIREFILGGVNHDRVRKWVKNVYMTRRKYHRETFPPQREADTTKIQY